MHATDVRSDGLWNKRVSLKGRLMEEEKFIEADGDLKSVRKRQK